MVVSAVGGKPPLLHGEASTCSPTLQGRWSRVSAQRRRSSSSRERGSPVHLALRVVLKKRLEISLGQASGSQDWLYIRTTWRAFKNAGDQNTPQTNSLQISVSSTRAAALFKCPRGFQHAATVKKDPQGQLRGRGQKIMKHGSAGSCSGGLGLPDWCGSQSHLVALDSQFYDIVSQTFNDCADFVAPGELCLKFCQSSDSKCPTVLPAWGCYNLHSR